MSGQVLLLLAEAGGLAIGLLVLFRLRHRWGPVPLYMTVGAFQFLQVILVKTVRVPIAEGMFVSPGSVVAFPATLLALLLVYIWKDARETRILIYGIVLANLLVSMSASMFGLHLGLEGAQNALKLPTEFFSASARVLLVGTAVLFVDSILVILLFEAARRITRVVFLRTLFALLAVLVFDTFAFLTLAFGPDRWAGMDAMILGKACAAMLYAAALAFYVRFVEHPQKAGGTKQPKDIGRLFRALTYKERFEEAQRLATLDGLTGLFNRAHFDHALHAAWERARKAREPLGLLLLDLDHFKSINDRFGHGVGDRVLKEFAQLVKQAARSSDPACRYGGDELAIVMPGATRGEAVDLAQRILGTVSARSAGEETTLPHFTVTIGVASIPEDGDTVDALLECADRRLLVGKRAGRGRVQGSDRAD